MFLLNSCLGLFCATLPEEGSPFSLSYGVRLPSSLTRDHSITLGHLSQPTRVGLRYGHSCFIGNEVFLGGLGPARLLRVSPPLPTTFSYSVRSGFTGSGITFGGERTMSSGCA